MSPVPHLAFPLRFDDGAAATVEQDSPEHMLQRIHVTCRTTRGERLDDPTFGIPSEVLRVTRADLDVLASAIEESEPDIAVTLSRPVPGLPEPPGFALPGARDDIRISVEEPA